MEGTPNRRNAAGVGAVTTTVVLVGVPGMMAVEIATEPSPHWVWISRVLVQNPVGADHAPAAPGKRKGHYRVAELIDRRLNVQIEPYELLIPCSAAKPTKGGARQAGALALSSLLGALIEGSSRWGLVARCR